MLSISKSIQDYILYKKVRKCPEISYMNHRNFPQIDHQPKMHTTLQMDCEVERNSSQLSTVKKIWWTMIKENLNYLSISTIENITKSFFFLPKDKEFFNAGKKSVREVCERAS